MTSNTYQLVVVQQPQRCRMCGFGDKDRRPISPPPCVQLIIRDAETGEDISCDESDMGGFVLMVHLFEESGQRDANFVHDLSDAGELRGENSHVRNLVGTDTVQAAPLHDLNSTLGHWFILSDLSVRTEGLFRLRFSVVQLCRPTTEQLAHRPRLSCPVLAVAYSDPFVVYSAKKFPGVCDATDLSRHFAAQGVKIPVRNND